MSEITKIVHAIEAGDPHAAAQLLPLVYDELRGWLLCVWPMRSRGRRWNLPRWFTRPTFAWLEINRYTVGTIAATFSPRRPRPCDEFSWTRPAASGRSVMAVDDDERHFRIITYFAKSPDDVLALDEALTRFASEEPAKAELVKLRFFAGLSTHEAASALGISVASAERWWAFARTWLFSELQRGHRSMKSFPNP